MLFITTNVVRLLIIRININNFGFYRAMKEKTDCNLLHEAINTFSLRTKTYIFVNFLTKKRLCLEFVYIDLLSEHLQDFNNNTFTIFIHNSTKYLIIISKSLFDISTKLLEISISLFEIPISFCRNVEVQSCNVESYNIGVHVLWYTTGKLQFPVTKGFLCRICCLWHYTFLSLNNILTYVKAKYISAMLSKMLRFQFNSVHVRGTNLTKPTIVLHINRRRHLSYLFLCTPVGRHTFQ